MNINYLMPVYIERYRISVWIKCNKIELWKLFDITSSKRIYESDYVTSGIPFYRSKEIIEKSKNKPTNINLFISNEKFEEIKLKYWAL